MMRFHRILLHFVIWFFVLFFALVLWMHTIWYQFNVTIKLFTICIVSILMQNQSTIARLSIINCTGWFFISTDTECEHLCGLLALEFADFLIYWAIGRLFECHIQSGLHRLINKSKVKWWVIAVGTLAFAVISIADWKSIYWLFLLRKRKTQIILAQPTHCYWIIEVRS